MKIVITYGTFDLMHYGHIRLLERARALGDYLIVGVTSDEFDRKRGKINVKQALMERIEGVRATGLADKIIVEEYEGQKIDDIRKFRASVFTVGSDWKGKFDYLRDYCEVIYLERTSGVSSSELRSGDNPVRLGIAGSTEYAAFHKYLRESRFVNGIEPTGIFSEKHIDVKETTPISIFGTYEDLLDSCDAVFLVSSPEKHYNMIQKALENGKHVLCESPIALNRNECESLFKEANRRGLILMEAVKTAYSIAYERLLLMIKNGVIGDVVSIEATCTSLRELQNRKKDFSNSWNSICAWGPTGLLPVFQVLGLGYKNKMIVSRLANNDEKYDLFSQIMFVYPNATATVKIAKGVKSEGNLIVSGTNAYLYVPAPWWKTDYFELRYENPDENRRFFYQLDGEGIRNEFVAFLHSIRDKSSLSCISLDVSLGIADVIGDFYSGKDCFVLEK